jgi:hypothetical protein
MIVYHGTDFEFDKFKQGSASVTTVFGSETVDRQGFFFTDDIKIARSFGKNVVTADIRMNKPMDFRNFKNKQILVDEKGWSETFLLQTETWELLDGDTGRELVKDLKSLGYDSLIMEEPLHSTGGLSTDSFTAYVVFDVDNIKILNKESKFESVIISILTECSS